MLKRDELTDPRSCLNKAADDEPVFVLRAQDKLSPILVELWAELARLNGCGVEKLTEAVKLAGRMRDWERTKFPD